MPKPEADFKKAIQKGDLPSVQRIVAAGLPVDAELPGKVTALEFALAQEQREIVWELLRLGAKPRKQKHENLLIDVPKFRDLELMRRLVDLGADVQSGNRTQLTPFLCAVAAGFYDAVRHLLDRGADPRARNELGESAFQLADRTRRFCTELLPGAEGELADLFRSQLADLDRIEAHLESILTPDEVQALRGPPPKPSEPSTFWDLNDWVEFRLEISPFPFTARKSSRLTGRLGRKADKQWLDHFTKAGRILFRVTAADHDGPWTPLTLQRLDGRFLVFTGETQLPAGDASIEVCIDSDWDMFAGNLQGWKIKV